MSASRAARLDASGEWLEGARRALSPNRDPRPTGVEIDLLVVHGISLPPGEFGGEHVEDLFLNRLATDAHPYFAGLVDLRVSAHVLVRRDGEAVQFVPFGDRAWHAGESEFEGRARCNDYSIGIELEGADDVAYEPVQYARLAAVARALMERWPAITPARVVGHCHVAPGRKTDPGPAFDWPALRRLLRKRS